MIRSICLLLLIGSGCREHKYPSGANSPEGIVLRMEQAHRQKNLDSILLNTDFQTMALLLIEKRGHPKTDSTVYFMAQALRASWTNEIKAQGFIDYSGIKTHEFDRKRKISDTLVSLNDTHRYHNGTVFTQYVLAVNRNGQWMYAGTAQ
jgi:hypothetical protein